MISKSILDEIIENHYQHYRDRRKQHVTFSLEGRYRPERNDADYEDEAPPPARKPINVVDAELLEDYITTLPYSHKLVYSVEKFYRFALVERHFNRTCRIARVRPDRWDDTYKEAVQMLIKLWFKRKI